MPNGKYKYFFILAAFFLQIFATNSLAEIIPPDGDINNDGFVDIRDLLLAQRILLGQYTPSVDEQQSWDVAPLVGGIPQPDGLNNAGDYLILSRMVLGIITVNNQAPDGSIDAPATDQKIGRAHV